MLTQRLMAAGNAEYVEVEPVDDEEKASLKASTGYGSTDDVYLTLHNNKKATPNTPHHNDHQQQNNASSSPPPTLARRMSSQLLFQVERQKSVVDNIGLTEKVNQYVPDSISQHIPGLNRRKSQLKLTYFYNICFTKYPIEEGFVLRRCQHQFCPECLCGFMTNKIENGVVNMTCFYPLDGSKLCNSIHYTYPTQLCKDFCQKYSEHAEKRLTKKIFIKPFLQTHGANMKNLSAI